MRIRVIWIMHMYLLKLQRKPLHTTEWPHQGVVRFQNPNQNLTLTLNQYILIAQTWSMYSSNTAIPAYIGRNKSFFQSLTPARFSLTTHQRQKFITVNFAKFRDTATNEVTKFRGKNHRFHGSFPVKIVNFAVKITNFAVKITNFAVKIKNFD